MNYQVVIPKPAQKQLDSLPQDIRERVLKALVKLKDNPLPQGCVKLKGYENEYRIRVGDYRVRYEIREKEFVVVLLHCKHRRDVYR
ncbi:MAG: type II toxin-antitoxin system mRNA interferase toxin, RelE/StbE family [Anaerolineae bacterium]|nr:type II toxin-antitoxin system RelE/ParE family toxin [Anaerolineales bacterium]MCQ3977768.1 type II toxin-antitoxin system mRNA interferase toxin, RelE/StbE family [Anaerolineae bacterium]